MKAAFAGVLLTGLLTAVAAHGAADPQLVGLMMPDAKVIAGFQLADSQSTPFGRFLLKQIPARPRLPRRRLSRRRLPLLTALLQRARGSPRSHRMRC